MCLIPNINVYFSVDLLTTNSVPNKPASPRGVALIFSAYVGLDPASTVHPKRISGISSTPKKYSKLKHPKKISQFCALTLKKDPKMHRKDPQTSLILWWPQKNIHKIFIPPKNIHFSENPKKYWNSEFWTQKIDRAYVCVKISEYPPCLFVCCFTSQVNSYGHGGMVSSPNHTFSWASLNKQFTSTLCTYFHL